MVDQVESFFQVNKHSSCNHLPIHVFQNIISEVNYRSFGRVLILKTRLAVKQ